MALTLKEAITATQTTIDVNGSDTLSNGDLYSIEDEQVFIETASAGSTQPGQTAWQRLTVQRGVLGTTEVAHDAGTSVTAVATPLGAGGEQTIRLLGPYRVNWNTANITGVGAQLGTVEQDVLVMEVRAVIVTPFTDPNSQLLVGVGPTADPTDWYQIAGLTLTPGSSSNGLRQSVVPSAVSQWVHCATTGGVLMAYLDPIHSAGAADIYALIAEPAA